MYMIRYDNSCVSMPVSIVTTITYIVIRFKVVCPTLGSAGGNSEDRGEPL